MYELKNTPSVDIDAERIAVVAHIKARWVGIEGIEQVVMGIQAQAFARGRAWIDEYPVATQVRALRLSREMKVEAALATEEERLLGPHYDRPGSLLFYMGLCTGALREAGLHLDGGWNYEKAVGSVYREVLKNNPGIATARPLGWDALAKGYTDFDGMADYSAKADVAAFKGANTATAGAGNFVERTALPYVMYDEMCQGRKAGAVLVGAIFAHFLGIVTHRNTQELLAAVAELPVDSFPAKVVFEATLASENPLLQTLIFMAEQKIGLIEGIHLDQAAYADALANARAFAALSEPEKEASRTQKEKEMLDGFGLSLAEDPDTVRKAAETALKTRGFLLSLIPSPM